MAFAADVKNCGAEKQCSPLHTEREKKILLKQVPAGILNVAYFDSGPTDGLPVFLLHGFPYDVHSYDAVIPVLVSNGCRVITPHLRGYGPTRFLNEGSPRSGQQAVLAHDLYR